LQTTRLETLGSAAAGIAHDINNQLTLILNHLAETDIEAALSAVNRCASLTSGLLSYCRGESLQLKRVNPAEFLFDFVEDLRLPHRIRIHFDLSDPVDIMADGVALIRVLTNLVVNACDAMNGAGTLTLGVRGSTISIEDTGPGIPRDASRQVFEPFFTTKGKAGTGLGLAIVREIMTQHGGLAVICSEPGRGARFELRFRAAQPIH